LADIRALIAEARRQTTVAVNMGLTLLYWRIGQRIHREVLGTERAAYGEQIVATLSRQLSCSHFSVKPSFFRMPAGAAQIGERPRTAYDPQNGRLFPNRHSPENQRSTRANPLGLSFRSVCGEGGRTS